MRRKNEPAGTECIAENNRGTAGICGHPASDHKCGQFSANDFIALHYTESQSGKRRCDQILPDENVSHSGLPGRCLCRISQGNVGKAIQLASSEEFGELKASVLQLMKRLEDIDLYEMTAAVKQIAEYKLTVNDYFDLMMIWFRDVLYMKATNDVNGLIFKDEVYDIKNRQQSGRIRELRRSFVHLRQRKSGFRQM